MKLKPAEPETRDALMHGLVPREGEHTSLPLRPRHGCRLPCGWEWRDINGHVTAVDPCQDLVYIACASLRFERGRLGLYTEGHVPVEVVAALLDAAPTKIPNTIRLLEEPRP
jgi:hypothetical protein